MQLFLRKDRFRALLLCLALAGKGLAVAHPIPDVPVRAWFNSDGSAQLEVELDLRCFVEDPLMEPYVVNATVQAMDDAGRSELMAPALPFFAKTAKILFDPAAVGEAEPKFTAEFGKIGGGELSDAEDPVAVMLRWTTKIPDGANAYRLDALESGELSVLFLNHLDGIKQKRMQVLFPGETSKPLDLTNIAADAKAGAAPAGNEDEDEGEGESVAGADHHGASARVDASVPTVNEGGKTAQQFIEDAERTLAENNQKTLIISAAIAVALGGIGFAFAKR